MVLVPKFVFCPLNRPKNVSECTKNVPEYPKCPKMCQNVHSVLKCLKMSKNVKKCPLCPKMSKYVLKFPNLSHCEKEEALISTAVKV